MATMILIAKIAAGAAITSYIATRKVDNNSEKGGIIIDNRKNPEVLNGILKGIH